MSEIAHISDTHLGIRQYNSDGVRRQDFNRAFKAAVELAIERGVDAILHSGDLFDSPSPPLTAVTDGCVEALKMVEDAETPFYAIVGNHERKLDRQWMDLFEDFGNASRLSEDPVVVGGDTVLYGFDAVRKPRWESKDFTVTDFSSDLDNPTKVVALHELFKPLVPEYRGDPYSISNFLSRFREANGWVPDYLALGDYHSQTTGEFEGTLVGYPGSTERCSVSEKSDRGFFIFDSDDKSVTPVRISDSSYEHTPREMRQMTIEVEESTTVKSIEKRVSEIGEDLSDSIVAVTLKGVPARETSSGLGKTEVKEVLREAGAMIPHVIDNRNYTSDRANHEPVEKVSSISDEIDSEIAKRDFSDEIDEAIQLIQSDVPKSEIRSRTAEILGGDEYDN